MALGQGKNCFGGELPVQFFSFGHDHRKHEHMSTINLLFPLLVVHVACLTALALPA